MIIAYHGSGTLIDKFDYRFTNRGRDQLGSGFYFTSNIDEAKHYTVAETSGLPKLGGTDCPTIHKVELKINTPLPRDFVCKLGKSHVERILKASPVFKDALENFGDISFEGEKKVLSRAIDSYSSSIDSPLLDTLFCLANDFYPEHIKEFNIIVNQVTGFDGVMETFSDSIHYVAWFPDQIKILEATPIANTVPQRKILRPK